MSSEPKTIRQLILNSHYAEFPETLTTLELSRAFARLDKRSVPVSLRATALMIAEKASNRHLKSTLREMASSPFPETHIVRIRECLKKMESRLEKELR